MLKNKDLWKLWQPRHFFFFFVIWGLLELFLHIFRMTSVMNYNLFVSKHSETVYYAFNEEEKILFVCERGVKVVSSSPSTNQTLLRNVLEKYQLLPSLGPYPSRMDPSAACGWTPQCTCWWCPRCPLTHAPASCRTESALRSTSMKN